MIILNGVEIKFKTYPNNETLCNTTQLVNNIGENNKIVFKYYNDTDLLKLMFIKKYLDEYNVKASLVIYYMPYSRLDRTEGNMVFTLKYVAELINSLNFDKVDILEPHSDVTMALINRSVGLSITQRLVNDAIKYTGWDKEKDYVYYPDAGADKRYSKLFNYKKLIGLKNRDFNTGNILNLQVFGNVPQENFKVIMIDDLCSKGGTFIMGAKKLKEMGASDIYLVVTHCEETIFNGEIIEDNNLISAVFTTNSILTNNKGYEKIKVLNLGGII